MESLPERVLERILLEAGSTQRLRGASYSEVYQRLSLVCSAWREVVQADDFRSELRKRTGKITNAARRDVFREQGELVSVIGLDELGIAESVAALHAQLYVIFCSSRTPDVYSLITYDTELCDYVHPTGESSVPVLVCSNRRNITPRSLRNTFHIAASPRFNCLYLLEFRVGKPGSHEQRVAKIKPDGIVQASWSLPLTSENELFSSLATSGSFVVLTSYETILVYDHNGMLVEKCKHQNTKKECFYGAVLLKNNQLLAFSVNRKKEADKRVRGGFIERISLKGQESKRLVLASLGVYRIGSNGFILLNAAEDSDLVLLVVNGKLFVFDPYKGNPRRVAWMSGQYCCLDTLRGLLLSCPSREPAGLTVHSLYK